MVVDDHSRIFNLLLNDIPKEEWPEELGRGNRATCAFHFFELVSKTDTFGSPLKPYDIQGKFDAKLDELAAALDKTLNTLKKTGASSTVREDTVVPPEKRIFFAAVPESLGKHQYRLMEHFKKTILTSFQMFLLPMNRPNTTQR